MALDPQIPLSVTQQPSFAKQAGEVYQLAGAMEKQQDIQRQNQDRQALQEAMKGGANIDTPEGIAELNKKLQGTISPEASMLLSKTYQELLERDAKVKEYHSKASNEETQNTLSKLNYAYETLEPAAIAYKEALKKNPKDIQGANLAYQTQIAQATQQMENMPQSGGQPFAPKQLVDQIRAMEPQQLISKLEANKHFQETIKAGADLQKTYAQTEEYLSAAEKNRAQAKIAEKGGAGGLSGILERGGEVGKKNLGAAIAESQANHPWLTIEEVGKRSQQAKALSSSIADQTKKLGQLSSFEQTAMANLDNLAEALKKQRDKNQVDIPAVNSFLNTIKKLVGQTSKEELDLYGQEVAAELTKLASSANASGAGGTLQDRQEWKTFFAPNSSFDQMMMSIGAARQSAKNRVNSSEGQIVNFEKRIDDLWRDPSEAPKETPKPAPTNTGKSTEVPRGAAPAGAIEKLKANPQLKEQFKAKYGYLPEGI